MAKCKNCHHTYMELDEDQGTRPCPKCGGLGKVIEVSGTVDLSAVKQFIKGKAYSPDEKRRKPGLDFAFGDELFQKEEKWTKKFRLINRRANRYTEVVLYAETGIIIHCCEEKLTDHKGHGSDKNKPQEQDNGYEVEP